MVVCNIVSINQKLRKKMSIVVDSFQVNKKTFFFNLSPLNILLIDKILIKMTI